MSQPLPAVSPLGTNLPVSLQRDFRELLRQYDARQWKPAVRTADKILKACKADHPHGDTLSFKAMCLYHLGKRTEAMALSKEGLRASLLRSPTAWWLMGLMHRGNGSVGDTLKCFRQALRLEPGNRTVARDMAVIQCHTADFEGAVETRTTLLRQAPTGVHYSGLAVVHALAGNLDMAALTVKSFEDDMAHPGAGQGAHVIQPHRLGWQVIVHECVMFRASLAMRAAYIGRGEDRAGAAAAAAASAALHARRALAILDAPSTSGGFQDGLEVGEVRGEALLFQGKCGEAAQVFLSLLGVNPDDAGFHHGLQCALLNRPDLWKAATLRNRFPCLAAAAAGAQGAAEGAASTSYLLPLLKAYASLTTQHPRSRLLRLILLEVLPAHHPLFTPLLACVLRGGLRKGLPSLFSEVKGLMRVVGEKGMGHAARLEARRAAAAAAVAVGGGSSTSSSGSSSSGSGGSTAALLPPKGATLHTLARTYHELCSATSTASASASISSGSPSSSSTLGVLPCPSPQWGAPSSAEGDLCWPPSLWRDSVGGDGERETPATVPWAALLWAKCQDEVGECEAALATLSASLTHTPTITDVYLTQARVLKHRGDRVGAAAAADHARSLDLADRYLNTRAAKYKARGGDVVGAEATVCLFVRTDASRPHQHPREVLKGNQVLWWELEAGEALERGGDTPAALRRFLRVGAMFDEFLEDLYDFHTYCPRKGTLRAYMDSVEWGRVVRGHSACVRAGVGAARCHLAAARDPTLAEPRAREGVLYTPAQLARMEPKERKLAEEKLKKAARREAEAAAAAAVAAAAAAAAAGAGVGGAPPPPPPKPTPDGEEEEGGKEASGEALDPFADLLFSTANHLQEARRHAKAVTGALPVGSRTGVAQAEAEAAGVGLGGGRHPALHPIGSIQGPGGANKEWIVSSALAGEAHAIAAECALLDGKALLAASHCGAAERMHMGGNPLPGPIKARLDKAMEGIKGSGVWGQ